MLRLSRTNLIKNIKVYCTKSKLPACIDLHPEIKSALHENKPIVALESTIITHGMPYPTNIKTALEVEQVVRNENAIPATIAIVNGRIKVGLEKSELEYLGNGENSNNVLKISRRDFGYVLSKNMSGGTTVSGTMIVANLVGIKIFATGGIGGVHREGHVTMDVSADLIELGQTPVAVVSSGVKSILDIPRTLEFLETHGVMVCTYNSPNSEFPAFYTRSSGTKALYNFTDVNDIAISIKANDDLNLKSGVLIGVPIPEEFAMDSAVINEAISNALKLAKEKGIEGKEVTPYLLSSISKITEGRSLTASMSALYFF